MFRHKKANVMVDSLEDKCRVSKRINRLGKIVGLSFADDVSKNFH